MCADSMDVIRELDEESIDLVVTSPPFSLRRPKSYGEPSSDVYVDWLLGFMSGILPKLRDTGSVVVDLGGSYEPGRPVRSLHPVRFAVRMVDELGYRLAQDLHWYNPAALPTPAEWVTKRKVRMKSATDYLWWFSKTDFPKADVGRVRTPYTKRTERFLRDPSEAVGDGRRPSGHVMKAESWRDNGGALPSDLISIPNTSSNDRYLRTCRALGVDRHPARFPRKLPETLVKMLTDEGDLVFDPFSGSNVTGAVAESLGRRWLASDVNRRFIASSAFRFVEGDGARSVYDAVFAGEFVDVSGFVVSDV